MEREKGFFLPDNLVRRETAALIYEDSTTIFMEKIERSGKKRCPVLTKSVFFSIMTVLFCNEGVGSPEQTMK